MATGAGRDRRRASFPEAGDREDQIERMLAERAERPELAEDLRAGRPERARGREADDETPA